MFETIGEGCITKEGGKGSVSMKYSIEEKEWILNYKGHIDICDIDAKWLYLQSICLIMMIPVYLDVVFYGCLVQQVAHIWFGGYQFYRSFLESATLFFSFRTKATFV